MKLTKSKLREIIREELLNEYQVDLSKMADRLGEFSKDLKGYQRRTTDPKWEKQLNSVIKDLNRLEDKFHNISRKLGIIPLK
jgi:C4-dicarboxylate-specific signal transduction histidine kinase|tara:strand:+ start:422 stop:667 length:246 start_codon:yes stop_codon:yes gene_type:complete